jgi:uncharacterized protein YqeY
MTALRGRLQEELKIAMRGGDHQRRDALRMLLAAIKQVEVDERRELDDAGVTQVLQRQAKQHRESIADAERAGRADLAAQATYELRVVESYLPQQLTADDIRALALPIIEELGVRDAKGAGMVLGRLMPAVRGKADGRLVSDVVRELLQER